MECYEGATMIKTFRGLIADGAQDTIVLHTNDGSTGYRIVKFELFPYKPGWKDHKSLVQIFKVAQTSIPTTEGTADFSNNVLLAAAFFTSTAVAGPVTLISVFDKEVFNQDIYVTHTQQAGGTPAVNYYIELEQVKLDLSESTVATLKDIRNEHRIPPG